MKKDQENWEILLKYIKGELSAKEKKDLEARLKSDKELALDFEILKTTQDLERTKGGEDKYSGFRVLSELQFREFKTGKKHGKIPYGIRTYDSELRPANPDVRGAFDTETKDTHRLKYKLDDLTLLIYSYPVSSETFDVRGRIIGMRENVPITVVIISGKTKFESICDESHVFEFIRVPALNYTLKIMRNDKVIGLADIKL
jgi:hypothetical protein